MESLLESLAAAAPVMIGFIVVVGLVVAAVVALLREDMKWLEKQAQQAQEHAQDLDRHRARIESGYGIQVSRNHIHQTQMSPHSGFVSRAVMGDGSLEEITLRGTELVPYRKDGNAWRPLPLTAEPAEALAGERR